MIKEVQRKFILTAMIAISILIVSLLGAINIINVGRVKNENQRLLDMLSRDEGIAPPKDDMEPVSDEPAPQSDYHRKGDREVAPGITEDAAKAARFFIVRLDEDNQVVHVNIDNISSVSEEEAADYAVWALGRDDTQGKKDSFIYKISDSKVGNGKTVVFLKTSSSTKSIVDVVLISLGIGVLGWLVMLVIVVALSKKAIRPIGENIERQKQFVTDAGHEIKTPLAIILANTEALELHQGESKWSTNIKSQTHRLNGLMNELLTLSKLDENTVNTACSETDISRILRSQIASFSESAALKGNSFNADIKDGLCIRADEESIIRLLGILLDNAIKYSTDKSKIDVKLGAHKSGPELCIVNECERLPEVQPDKLFDRFYRGDSARTQKNGGYGIGLSIAKGIVDKYGGRISCEYPEGNKIKFVVRL